MKNILILSHVNSNDPLYCSYVHDHAKALVKSNNNVVVFAVNNWFPFIKKKIKARTIVDNNVEIRYINRLSISNFLYNLNINGYLYYLKVKKEIKKLLKTNKIDLIDAHTFKIEGYAAYLLKKKYGIKTFVTLHGTSFQRNFDTENGKKLIKKIASVIDSYICVSDKIKRNLETLNIKNCSTIYNGIDFLDVQRNNNNYNIITVAYFSKLKNIDLVIKAFSLIHNKLKEAKLTIVGDGEIRKELESLVKELNLSESIEFTGILDKHEVFKRLSNSNIFVLPSKSEGFGISYVEAMYSGCIPIGTKNEGVDGFIKDGYNGFLVNPNVDEIFEKLEEILYNNKDSENLRSNAIKSSLKMSWDNNAKSYLKLLEDD